MTYTSVDNYFEDFAVGEVYEHTRGRTVSNIDNLWLTHMSLNTAQAHFNLDHATAMLDGTFRERLVMGAVTLALVVGLTSEDMSENAIAELGLTGIRMPAPVYRGDTLFATSTVLDVGPSDQREDAGVLTYQFSGAKSDGSIVIQGTRQVLLKRRGSWADADDAKEPAR